MVVVMGMGNGMDIMRILSWSEKYLYHLILTCHYTKHIIVKKTSSK